MERVLRIGLVLTAFWAFGMNLFGAPQTAAPGAWLDARTANWNRPGAAIPVAPKGTGQPPSRCAGMLAKDCWDLMGCAARMNISCSFS
jgi:hypothetical protein